MGFCEHGNSDQLGNETVQKHSGERTLKTVKPSTRMSTVFMCPSTCAMNSTRFFSARLASHVLSM
jgi:hypothetical protein